MSELELLLFMLAIAAIVSLPAVALQHVLLRHLKPRPGLAALHPRRLPWWVFAGFAGLFLLASVAEAAWGGKWFAGVFAGYAALAVVAAVGAFRRGRVSPASESRAAPGTSLE